MINMIIMDTNVPDDILCGHLRTIENQFVVRTESRIITDIFVFCGHQTTKYICKRENINYIL